MYRHKHVDDIIYVTTDVAAGGLNVLRNAAEVEA